MVGGPAYSDRSQRPDAGFQSVSPDYFKPFGIQVLKGRLFNEQDTASSMRVAIVNEEFVHRYLKGLDPFKQHLSMEQIIPGLPKLGPAVKWRIVGVIHNVRYGDFREADPEIEIGLRIALGASKLRVIWLVLKEASLLAAIGLGIGLVGCVLIGRTMRTTLYGVATMDFSVIISVGVLLFLAALFASYLPARRAASIDPMRALRTD